MSAQHSLLLLQRNLSVASRTYSSFESKAECLLYVCEMFEEELKKEQGDDRLQYEATRLLEFVDRLEDVICLVEKKRGADQRYIPHGKDWLKNQLIKMLRAQAI